MGRKVARHWRADNRADAPYFRHISLGATRCGAHRAGRGGDNGGSVRWQGAGRGEPVPVVPTSISTHFAGVPDPRVERTKEHRLVDILTIGLCAVICGADGWSDMATFGQAKERWLRTFLALPSGIPSHDTFGRVFARLDPEAFGRCFVAWVRAVAPETLGHVRP